MTFAQFSNKIKNFVLSLEQKRRLYFAICSIVYSATKRNSIKVPSISIFILPTSNPKRSKHSVSAPVSIAKSVA